jgi:hypothetical protein
MSAFDPLQTFKRWRYESGMSRPSEPEELAAYFRSIGHAATKAAELARAFIASEANVLTEARKFYPGVEIDAVGPLCASDLDPWGCWIKVDTDDRRNTFLADEDLIGRLGDAAEAGGWPAIITVESQETVDRDYEGSWFYRLR